MIRPVESVQLDLVPRDTIPAAYTAPALLKDHTGGNTGWPQSGRDATFELDFMVQNSEQPHLLPAHHGARLDYGLAPAPSDDMHDCVWKPTLVSIGLGGMKRQGGTR